MDKPLTPYQEKFCQNVASGMSYKDSFIDAYNTKNYTIESIYAKSSEMMADVKIMLRVDELRLKEFDYTREQSFNKLNYYQDMAEDEKKFNDCIKAEQLKGELTGLYVKQTENLNKNANIDIKDISLIEDVISKLDNV